MIFLGNPGGGKSTLLNSVAGKMIFSSGISIGKGLTDKVFSTTVDNVTYCDTPGLSDPASRNEAGMAISKLLREGGTCRICFIVTLERGRVKPDDTATMISILNAAPEIGNRYGIIVNQCSKKVKAKLSHQDNYVELVTHLFMGVAEECKHDKIHFVMEYDILKDEDNAYIGSENMAGLDDFLHDTVPKVDLTPGLATDIAADELEALKMKHKELIAEQHARWEKHKELKIKELREMNSKLREFRYNRGNKCSYVSVLKD